MRKRLRVPAYAGPRSDGSAAGVEALKDSRPLGWRRIRPGCTQAREIRFTEGHTTLTYVQRHEGGYHSNQHPICLAGQGHHRCEFPRHVQRQPGEADRCAPNVTFGFPPNIWRISDGVDTPRLLVSIFRFLKEPHHCSQEQSCLLNPDIGKPPENGLRDALRGCDALRSADSSAKSRLPAADTLVHRGDQDTRCAFAQARQSSQATRSDCDRRPLVSGRQGSQIRISPPPCPKPAVHRSATQTRRGPLRPVALLLLGPLESHKLSD